MSFTIPREMMQLHETAETLGLGAVNSARERILRNMERTERILRDVDKAERIQKQVEAVTAAERALRRIDEVRAGIWRSMSRFQHRALENLERIRREMEIIDRVRRQVQIVRTGAHAMRHNQDGASGKSRKSSAKRSTKSASGGGNSGGDSDGGGDGPARTPSKSKKPRSKVRSTSFQRLPRSSSGDTATTSPAQVLRNPPQPNNIIAISAMAALFGIALTKPSLLILGLIVICLLIIVLVAMGHANLAKHVWNSAPKLLKLSTKYSDEESEDPDEES